MVLRVSLQVYFGNAQFHFLAPFQKKINVGRKQEDFLRVCDYVLKRFCYPRCLEDLDIRVGG
jgi:hypothetical protein